MRVYVKLNWIMLFWHDGLGLQSRNVHSVHYVTVRLLNFGFFFSLFLLLLHSCHCQLRVSWLSTPWWCQLFLTWPFIYEPSKSQTIQKPSEGKSEYQNACHWRSAVNNESPSFTHYRLKHFKCSLYCCQL